MSTVIEPIEPASNGWVGRGSQRQCLDREHNPPQHMSIPDGHRMVHTCPGCHRPGRQTSMPGVRPSACRAVPAQEGQPMMDAEDVTTRAIEVIAEQLYDLLPFSSAHRRAAVIGRKLAAEGLHIRPEVDDDTRREVERLVALLRDDYCSWMSDEDLHRAGDLLSRFVLGEVTDGE